MKVEKENRPKEVSKNTLYRGKIYPAWEEPVGPVIPEIRCEERMFNHTEPMVNTDIENTDENKLKMLDLFSGTGSVSTVFEKHGYSVISLDMAPHFKPTINVDIMQWDYKKSQYKPGEFDVIFASPPCNELSRA